MDAHGKSPGGGKKPARPAPATDATQQQPTERAALETPASLCDGDDADAAQQVDVAQHDVAQVDESHGAAVGGSGNDEEDDRDDDDEQVERFYALLANIRAMRGLAPLNVASSSFRGDNDDTGTDTAGDRDGSTRTKKRLRRSAEPPWTPAFRMEDFEEPAPPASSTSCKLRKLTTGAGHDDDHCGHGESSGGSAGPTSVAVVASSSLSSMPHAAVRFQQSDSSS